MNSPKEMIESLRNIFSGDSKAQKHLDYLEKNITTAKSKPKPKSSSNSNNVVQVFTDGACRGNPGPGSWAAFARDENEEVLFRSSGVETRTTNNVMELEAACQSLETLIEGEYLGEKEKVELFSDSKYVVDGFNSWMINWKKRGWKKADKKAPENLDHWIRLDNAKEQVNVKFFWVKGHSGHPENDEVDRMANEALDDAGF